MRNEMFEYELVEAKSRQDFITQLNILGRKGFRVSKYFVSPPGRDLFYTALLERFVS